MQQVPPNPSVQDTIPTAGLPPPAMERIGLTITIDDAEVDQMVYERAARKSGLVDRVIRFMNAHDALEYLRENPDQKVDLILLDMNMPRMTGLEFLAAATREFGADFAARCYIMLGNGLTPAVRRQVEAFSVMKGYIEKPLTVETLQTLALARN